MHAILYSLKPTRANSQVYKTSQNVNITFRSTTYNINVLRTAENLNRIEGPLQHLTERGNWVFIRL